MDYEKSINKFEIKERIGHLSNYGTVTFSINLLITFGMIINSARWHWDDFVRSEISP